MANPLDELKKYFKKELNEYLKSQNISKDTYEFIIHMDEDGYDEISIFDFLHKNNILDRDKIYLICLTDYINKLSNMKVIKYFAFNDNLKEKIKYENLYKYLYNLKVNNLDLYTVNTEFIIKYNLFENKHFKQKYDFYYYAMSNYDLNKKFDEDNFNGLINEIISSINEKEKQYILKALRA